MIWCSKNSKIDVQIGGRYIDHQASKDEGADDSMIKLVAD